MVRVRELARYDAALSRCDTCGAWQLPPQLARRPHACREPYTQRVAECYPSDMATVDEMTAAAERRVRILKHIREGVERHWTPPTVTELAELEGVSRRQVAWDLDLLEREGMIEQDTEHRPRVIRVAGYRVRVEPVPAEVTP